MPHTDPPIINSTNVVMRAAECNWFAECYKALQETTGAIVPPRKELTLPRAKKFLRSLCIYHIEEPRRMTARLRGSDVVARTGFNDTSMNLFERIREERRDWTWSYYQHLLKTPCGALLHTIEASARREAEVEVVNFPLCDSSGEVTLIASVSAVVGYKDPLHPENEAVKFKGVVDYQYFDIGNGTGT